MILWLRHRRACNAVEEELQRRARQRVELTGFGSSGGGYQEVRAGGELACGRQES